MFGDRRGGVVDEWRRSEVRNLDKGKRTIDNLKNLKNLKNLDNPKV
jgi:hypothetical protein